MEINLEIRKVILPLSLAILMASVVGCATPRQVSALQGVGNKQVYAANFDSVWRSVVDAAQSGGLRVVTSDRTTGFIDARRSFRVHTFGENVAIWVTPSTPETTTVEVVSRQAGPPLAWFKNWEKEIHSAIAANLSREIPALVPPPP